MKYLGKPLRLSPHSGIRTKLNHYHVAAGMTVMVLLLSRSLCLECLPLEIASEEMLSTSHYAASYNFALQSDKWMSKDNTGANNQAKPSRERYLFIASYALEVFVYPLWWGYAGWICIESVEARDVSSSYSALDKPFRDDKHAILDGKFGTPDDLLSWLSKLNGEGPQPKF
ncbi:hypothetical protein Tco_0657239 [Tanacetum coccineum]|uniref:Uncharacterized protein n=1 Tax=Tanacetum coccineum TaxID=301880 RepID=A0ABQ4XC71_9ASTR